MKKLLTIFGFVLALGVGRSFAANNTTPIFASTPDVQGCTLVGSIGKTTSDGSGTINTNMFVAFKADATHGSYINKMRITAAASAATSMTASVIRVYITTVTANAGVCDPVGTWVIQEMAVAALAADNASNSVNYYEFPLNIALNAGWALVVSINNNLAANTRWQVVTFGEDF